VTCLLLLRDSYQTNVNLKSSLFIFLLYDSLVSKHGAQKIYLKKYLKCA